MTGILFPELGLPLDALRALQFERLRTTLRKCRASSTT